MKTNRYASSICPSAKRSTSYEGCRKARAFSFSPDGNYAVAGSFTAGYLSIACPATQLVKP